MISQQNLTKKILKFQLISSREDTYKYLISLQINKKIYSSFKIWQNEIFLLNISNLKIPYKYIKNETYI